MDAVSEALELGANAYVEKPLVIGVDFENLIRRIDSLLAI